MDPQADSKERELVDEIDGIRDRPDGRPGGQTPDEGAGNGEGAD